jgi:DNA invertase Pin-like site-specific DNA recombinase
MTRTKAPRAYSYRRFSQSVQAEGGSVARQTRMAAEYCKRKRFALDDSLTLDDFGVSAFRGDNVREGALAGFLEACRTGRVPRGSYLIVESLDRLSRDQIRPALQLFLQLQDYGIVIVTLQPEREYRPDGTDALALIEPLIVFARSHEESLMKSHRRRDAWRQARDRARAGGGPMLRTCPAWLEVVDGRFRVKEEAAAAVRQVFALARDGLGTYRIAERLNAAGVPVIGHGGQWV